MEVQGRIKLIKETESFGTNNFQKREMVVTTEEQYPQHILLEFVQDKCSLLDTYQVGQSVKVGINIRGREWVNPQGESKYFNSIQGWRIDKMEGASTGNVPPPDQFEPANDLNDDYDDDLGF